MTDEWADEVARIYRAEIAKHGPDGADRKEVMASAAARIERMIREDGLQYSLSRYVRSELLRADEADGKRADDIIRVAATGQGAFESVDLDVAVTLGRGRRKLWRDVRADDLRSMNAVRFRNFQDVKKSYDAWFRNYRLALPVLVEFETFGAAVAAGGFPPKTASAAA